MTREEQLEYCTVCQNRKMDMNKGLVCGLTNELATFQDSCESFIADQVKQKEQEIQNEIDQLEKETGSPWRIVLSVALILFALIRIIMRLSNN